MTAGNSENIAVGKGDHGGTARHRHRLVNAAVPRIPNPSSGSRDNIENPSRGAGGHDENAEGGYDLPDAD
eukprot:8231665-Alexandrium_andersonii.AAC.1